MEGMNKAILIGNLGADPELRFTQSGTAVLNMRLATTRSYLDANKVRQEATDWHSVIVWGKRGEGLAKILSKGSRVAVDGRIQTSSYEKDGDKRYKTEVVAENVVLCGGAGGAAAQAQSARNGTGHNGSDTDFNPADFNPPGGDDDQP